MDAEVDKNKSSIKLWRRKKEISVGFAVASQIGKN
jgi:hypothetical protein